LERCLGLLEGCPDQALPILYRFRETGLQVGGQARQGFLNGAASAQVCQASGSCAVRQGGDQASSMEQLKFLEVLAGQA
jgi:hypothetical protein